MTNRCSDEPDRPVPEGDERCKLVDQHWDFMVKTAVAMKRGDDDLEGLESITYLKLRGAKNGCAGCACTNACFPDMTKGNREAFIITTMNNARRDIWRSRKRRGERERLFHEGEDPAVPDPASTSAGDGQRHGQIAVRKALAALDGRTRNVAYLRIIWELPHDSIARAMATPTRTVERAWRAFRQRMMKCLAPDDLVAAAPALLDESSWPRPSDALLERLAGLYRSQPSELVGDPAEEMRLQRRIKWGTAAMCVVPPIAPLPIEWVGRHLLLYVVATVYVFAVASFLVWRRSFVAAVAAAALGLFALADTLSWLRIYKAIGGSGFPTSLAVLDVAAYVTIALSAYALIRRSRRSAHAPAARAVHAYFALYCGIACVYWLLAAWPLRGHVLISAIRNEWRLDASAASLPIDGLAFMTLQVWALYGTCAIAAIALMHWRYSLRVACRWLLLPSAAYFALGPWETEPTIWLRACFLILPLAALADWLWSRRRQKGWV